MSIIGKAKFTIQQVTLMMIAVVALMLCVSEANVFSQTGGKLQIKTLSSRPDMVSGGDALIEVKLPQAHS